MNYDIPGSSDMPQMPRAERGLPCVTGRARDRRLSEIVTDLAREAAGPVSIARLRDELGDRSFAAILVLFALFNLLPLPPGSTLIFGIPLMLVSGQMVLGYRSVWLPRFMLDKSISAERFRAAAARMVPMLQRLERTVRPRHWPFSGALGDRLIGFAAFILSVVVFLPIPLGNWLPAFTIAVLGIALSERDGVLFGAGILLGIASFAVIGAVVGTAGVMASAMFGINW